MDYIESDMDFSPLFSSEEYQSFYIEKSDLYKKISSNAVKSVEFIATKNQEFYFIEARSSFPRTKNSGNVEKEEQILYDKLHHSIDLMVAKMVGVKKHLKHNFSNELGCPDVLDKNLSDHKVFFFVVMNEKFKEEWCVDVLTSLNKRLIPLRKIWDISVKVISEEEARRLKMVI